MVTLTDLKEAIRTLVRPGDVTNPTEMRTVIREELDRKYLGRDIGVVWQYGGGVVGSKQDLLVEHPRYAEETPDGAVLISDYFGNRVFEVDKGSMDVIWEFTDLDEPNCAHRLANGNTMIVDSGNERIIEVNPAGAIVWTYTLAGSNMYDAVLVEANELLITYFTGAFATAVGHVRKINYPAGTTIWDVNVGTPSAPRCIALETSLVSMEYGNYLIGDAYNRVFELRDSDQAIMWTYGVLGENIHAFNRGTWMAGVCIGWTDSPGKTVFIADAQAGRVFAINREEHTVWQYGWSYPRPLIGVPTTTVRHRPGILLNTPDSVFITKRGTLLIADSGGSKVVEILLREYEIPREWARLFLEEEIRDALAHNSYVAETGWYPWKSKLITVENGLDQNVDVQVEGSRDGTFTNPYDIGAAVTVNAGTTEAIVINDPVQFLRLEATAAGVPTSGSLTSTVEMFDDG